MPLIRFYNMYNDELQHIITDKQIEIKEEVLGTTFLVGDNEVAKLDDEGFWYVAGVSQGEDYIDTCARRIVIT